MQEGSSSVERALHIAEQLWVGRRGGGRRKKVVAENRRNEYRGGEMGTQAQMAAKILSYIHTHTHTLMHTNKHSTHF